MSLDLNALRAMRKSSSSTLAKITSELQKQESGGNARSADERVWKCSVDKAGNGSAIIRFLPARPDDELPWVKTFDKGFQGPTTGKWYIEKCLSTIGQPDPVQEFIAPLWNGSQEDLDRARKMKRRASYYANVLVVKDPADPSNEGKVKLFKMGKKLFDKIKDKLQPTFADETPMDVFDPFEGANFRLRIRKLDGFSNTDKSEFDGASELCGGDEEQMVAVLNARHRLGEFTDPATFKSYAELAKKLDQVMSTNAPSASARKAAEFALEDVPFAPPYVAAKAVAEPVRAEAQVKVAAPADDADDDMAFFKGLLD